MKKVILKILPRYLRYLVRSLPDYLYDVNRYYHHSSMELGYHHTTDKLTAKIIERYHSIEKGLTMPEFKPGFGTKQLVRLIDDCCYHRTNYKTRHPQVNHGVSVVYEYESLHKSLAFELPEDVLDALKRLHSLYGDVVINSQPKITRSQYFSEAESSFEKFARSRGSIRNYTSEPVSIEKIRHSILLAQTSPSACNRQSTRVYVYTDPEEISKILQLQGGNRGFGHLCDKLIVVTCTLSAWGFINERYQSYVDGGIFAMNLLNGLHYNKVAACILNCSVSPKKDKDLRVACRVNDDENFISMISCGNPPERFEKAFSKRFDLEDIIKINPE